MNVTGTMVNLKINASGIGSEYKRWYNLINEKEHIVENDLLALTMQPYDVVWLKAWEN